MSFYFRDEVLPYYAGDTTDARELAANDFKYWELMRRACEARRCASSTTAAARSAPARSISSRTGDSRRRRSPTNSSCVKRDAIPQNNPLNPKYRALIALWRRLPRPAANALGPHIVRSLG